MLIWDGTDLITPLNAFDLTVCRYNGSPHLCFTDAKLEISFARGKDIILENTYNQVATVQSGNGMPMVDLHEFKLHDEGTSAMVTIYNPIPYHPSVHGIQNVSWVTESVFQKIDIATGTVLFEWRSLDHVPVYLSQVLPGTTDVSGDGLTKETSWDYL